MSHIKMPQIKVRFAPSPTGFLHIGGVRTAIFNWLFARHNNGQFLLRIEDTDKERSTAEHIDVILKGLAWMGLEPDAPYVLQSQNIKRHQEVAHQLLELGHAYRCNCPKDAEHKTLRPKCPQDCRNKNVSRDEPYVIRLKMPEDGVTEIHDNVQGRVKVKNETLEDLVLLRQDGFPVYMLSVVVDDHDMGITHVIRGDDHLTNTFKQVQIYKFLGWDVPEFAHIPLIHGSDGAKLSKRHGALGIDHYEKLGMLPDAMFNYLLRLGWAHGNDEIISRQDAINWFSLDAVGRSPSRFDTDKLLSLNGVYLRQTDDDALLSGLKRLGFTITHEKRFLKGAAEIKKRSKTLIELYDNARFYFDAPQEFEFIGYDPVVLDEYIQVLEAVNDFTETCLLDTSKAFAESKNIKLVDIAQPLRVALTGKKVSPSVFQIMDILGKIESISRMRQFVKKAHYA